MISTQLKTISNNISSENQILIQEALSTNYSLGAKITDKNKIRAFKQIPTDLINTEIAYHFLKSFKDLDYTLRNIDSYYESKKGKLFKELINSLPNDLLKEFIHEVNSSDITAYIVEKLHCDQDWLKSMYYTNQRISEHAKWYITDIEELLKYHYCVGENAKIIEIDDMIDAVGDNQQYKISEEFARDFYPYVINNIEILKSLPELVLCNIEDKMKLFESYLVPGIQDRTQLKIIIIKRTNEYKLLGKLLMYETNDDIRRIIRKKMKRLFQ